MMGYEKHFLCSRWGMKSSLIVRNYPPPWYPGLKMTTPYDVKTQNYPPAHSHGSVTFWTLTRLFSYVVAIMHNDPLLFYLLVNLLALLNRVKGVELDKKRPLRASLMFDISRLVRIFHYMPKGRKVDRSFLKFLLKHS